MPVTSQNIRTRPYLAGNFRAPDFVDSPVPPVAIPAAAMPIVVTRYRNDHVIYPTNLVRNRLSITQPTATDARYGLSGVADGAGDVIYLKYFDNKISSVRLPCPAPAGVNLFITDTLTGCKFFVDTINGSADLMVYHANTHNFSAGLLADCDVQTVGASNELDQLHILAVGDYSNHAVILNNVASCAKAVYYGAGGNAERRKLAQGRGQGRTFTAGRPLFAGGCTIVGIPHGNTWRFYYPFSPLEKDGKLFGLGSNDAGGALVSLIAAFLHFYDQKDLSHNLILAATAEEEISGHNGIELLLPLLGRIDWGIVGEPTKMQLAVAEKGLLVLDCIVHGVAGHAAREEGDNAIYRAIRDIEWFHQYRFDRVSDLLGPVKMSVTVIDTDNKAHNVVPSQCHFVVDIRVNELYAFEEILKTVHKHTGCDAQPRSLRMRSSSIPETHPVVRTGIAAGRSCYGSPTTSDKALMPFPTLKTGPGDSARSHTADEYIHIAEIEEGIVSYIQLLEPLLKDEL